MGERLTVQGTTFTVEFPDPPVEQVPNRFRSLLNEAWRSRAVYKARLRAIARIKDASRFEASLNAAVARVKTENPKLADGKVRESAIELCRALVPGFVDPLELYHIQLTEEDILS